MSIDTEIHYGHADKLWLDPKNPRLGRRFAATKPKQPQLREKLADAAIGELLVSFLESGFWPQEALIATQETINGEKRIVVIEGNRRLAALKILSDYASDRSVDERWLSLLDGTEPSDLDWIEEIPYLLVPSRSQITAYIGFRHVSGIKQWNPAEKAEYIAAMIDDEAMTYEQVMRQIGSKTSTVRGHYISY